MVGQRRRPAAELVVGEPWRPAAELVVGLAPPSVGVPCNWVAGRLAEVEAGAAAAGLHGRQGRSPSVGAAPGHRAPPGLPNHPGRLAGAAPACAARRRRSRSPKCSPVPVVTRRATPGTPGTPGAVVKRSPLCALVLPQLESDRLQRRRCRAWAGRMAELSDWLSLLEPSTS